MCSIDQKKHYIYELNNQSKYLKSQYFFIYYIYRFVSLCFTVTEKHDFVSY